MWKLNSFSWFAIVSWCDWRHWFKDWLSLFSAKLFLESMLTSDNLEPKDKFVKYSFFSSILADLKKKASHQVKPLNKWFKEQKNYMYKWKLNIFKKKVLHYTQWSLFSGTLLPDLLIISKMTGRLWWCSHFLNQRWHSSLIGVCTL